MQRSDSRVRVALVGDVALDLIAPYFRDAGYDVYVPPGFGTWRRELLDGASGLVKFAPDFIFDVTAHDGVLSAEVAGFFDERMRSLASMPYSLDGIYALVEEFEFFRRAAPRKILAVDADGTLWRGTLAEDGPQGVSVCRTFQEGLLELRRNGVVLALLSKNAPADSLIPPGMPLEDSHFAVRRVDWTSKPANLADACRELNIGVDSVLFLDDNPVERAAMEHALPEVAVAPWSGWTEGPATPDVQARQLLRRLGEYFFSGAGSTEEDGLRSSDYSAAARREELRRAVGHSDERSYLRSLGLWVAPSPAAEEDVPRLVQMAARTNQFNATTVRRTASDFERLLRPDSGSRVFVFRAGDRFADQGLVCYVVADTSSRRITDFVMSCRAMGRTLEHFAYAHVSGALGFAPEIDFVPSRKNAPFRAFLDEIAGLRGAPETFYSVKKV